MSEVELMERDRAFGTFTGRFWLDCIVDSQSVSSYNSSVVTSDTVAV